MPAQLLQQLEGHLRGALERRALRRVEVYRPFAHVLVRHELAADHVVQRNVSEGGDDRDADDDARMVERPVHAPRVPPVEPVEEAALPLSCDRRRASASFRNRELSIGVSVKLTSIDTRIANAIVQPNGLMKRLRVAVHERDRQEDDDERQRRRHDRQRDLARALDRRLDTASSSSPRCSGRCSPAPRSRRR
mgnify:CR=1 FL=1